MSQSFPAPFPPPFDTAQRALELFDRAVLFKDSRQVINMLEGQLQRMPMKKEFARYWPLLLNRKAGNLDGTGYTGSLIFLLLYPLALSCVLPLWFSSIFLVFPRDLACARRPHPTRVHLSISFCRPLSALFSRPRTGACYLIVAFTKEPYADLVAKNALVRLQAEYAGQADGNDIRMLTDKVREGGKLNEALAAPELDALRVRLDAGDIAESEAPEIVYHLECDHKKGHSCSTSQNPSKFYMFDLYPNGTVTRYVHRV